MQMTFWKLWGTKFDPLRSDAIYSSEKKDSVLVPKCCVAEAIGRWDSWQPFIFSSVVKWRRCREWVSCSTSTQIVRNTLIWTVITESSNCLWYRMISRNSWNFISSVQCEIWSIELTLEVSWNIGVRNSYYCSISVHFYPVAGLRDHWRSLWISI